MKLSAEETLDDTLKTFRYPSLFASLRTAQTAPISQLSPDSQDGRISWYSCTARINVEFPFYDKDGEESTDDLADFLEQFDEAITAAREEDDWAVLMRPQVDGELKDVLKEIQNDRLTWPAARELLEKRLMRPIHRFRLLEKAIDTSFPDSLTEHANITRYLKPARKLQILKLEEMIFFVLYYSLSVEARKEIQIPDDPAKCTLEEFQRLAERSNKLHAPLDRPVKTNQPTTGSAKRSRKSDGQEATTSGKWCTHHQTHSHDTSGCMALRSRQIARVTPVAAANPRSNACYT
ncbi:hypothetical protein LPJ81_006191 [Coemansia sp. IMI 209127]|nr:hypothetical protein LPJ81_006191 [Coemansia sp. IMI 209127]